MTDQSTACLAEFRNMTTFLGKNTIFNKHLVVNNKEVILKARAAELKASVRELEDDGVKGMSLRMRGLSLTKPIWQHWPIPP